MIVPLNNDNSNEVYLFFSPRRCITNSLSREENHFHHLPQVDAVGRELLSPPAAGRW
ncbi:MAG TPA: hypothetical protein VFB12_11050 [Ktedonobacteraceae bacterium]|nr:hypothetical protein [Ktedonobacteraceae bacterium]